ncbi:hypothetical protein NK553_01220 [Pseudomonas sp. ZM23]|uniref:Uncharacterized protein n=2 Tax=Pseudomonas triclosanedens TaxID=2961893 RepID=A0ABY6ZY59_9PSED|nr:hypothetical protein [Pseudomonas triclosanedens]MCP8462562.1 hypothetical protein [Pseudomonas triclosanedens]WAI49753.1 hypothetical protein OU419_00345 [Pseudomonas triclosanedens]
MLFRTAKGHLSLNMEDDPANQWPSLLEHLHALGAATVQHDHIGGTFDVTIGPHFRLGDVLLKSGWDNWSGYYLIADCAQGDAILQQLHAWLLAPR